VNRTAPAATGAPVNALPALLPGEEPAEYEALHARLRDAVAPQDAIEELWVDDVVDLTSEMQRLRRIKAGIVRLAMGEALDQLLQPALGSCRSAIW
jgi:hypothetical protein